MTMHHPQLETLIDQLSPAELEILRADINRRLGKNGSATPSPKDEPTAEEDAGFTELEQLSGADWKKRLDTWIAGHGQNPNVDDSRESIYTGRS